MDAQNYKQELFKKRKEFLNSQQHKEINRQLRECNRQKTRDGLFQRARKISPSPPPAEMDKENDVVETRGSNTTGVISAVNISTTVKLISTARDPGKLKKQEAYIMRFLNWRKIRREKQEQQNCGASKRRPFVSAICLNAGFGGGTSDVKSVKQKTASASHQQPSFVPEGHNGFKPPPGVKHPEEMIKGKLRGRQSIYTVVPTPPKKTQPSNQFPIHASVSTRSNKRNLNAAPKPSASKLESNVGTNKRILYSDPKPSVSKSQNNVGTKIVNLKSADKNNATTKTTFKAATLTNKSRPLKILPPPPVPARKLPSSGRIAKSDSAAPKSNIGRNKVTESRKRTENAKRVVYAKRAAGKISPTQPHKNARLTQTMKAKKFTKATSGQAAKIVSLMMCHTNDNTIVQTPREFSNTNKFEEFVTSTAVKNSSSTLEVDNGISPIEPLKNRSMSAKRNILKPTAIIADSDKRDVEKPAQNTLSRFNFIRYSEINDTNGDEEVSENIQFKAEMGLEYISNLKDNENLKLIADKTLQNEITSPKIKSSEECKEVNYLSPFVSVSRGKVSLKKEKEKRNSIYLASPGIGAGTLSNVSDQNGSVGLSSDKSPGYSVEVRRTLEAVRYYRKQLQDEIDRLHQKCDFWEAYKEENIDMLQAANVDDMIDVSVGQTRLLTSKKFMQFKDLIDRCEAGATGIGKRSYDGSEATKFISSTDLEGFWSMLGLQVENLEQRFANLNRWKDNSWQDPDEAKPKATKQKSRTQIKKKTVPAAKAKPNSALQQLLRKKQAEMRISKANNMPATSDVLVLTPTVVKDRKYYSPAATIISTPKSSTKSSIRASVESQAKVRSPQMQTMKSILKTPVSARTCLRNVMFSQKCRVKKFNFIRNDVGEESDADMAENGESIEEDIKQNSQENEQEPENSPMSVSGTYSLRNRKVRLRPSSEIVIPRLN